MKVILSAAAIVVLGVASALAQRAQAPPADVPSYTIHQATGPIVVDGRADEADWQAAAGIDFIFPWDDITKTAPQSTVARMLWDANNLYVLYQCVDPYLDAKVTQHDGPVWEEDAVEIFATPNANNLNAYYGYEMNAAGTFLDYLAHDAGIKRTDKTCFEWQSEGVQIATTLDGTLNDHSDRDRGWVLEVAIPLDNFRHLGGQIPPRDGDLWRLNLNRTKGYEGQFSMWSDSHAPEASFHHSAYFGKAYFSTAKVRP